MPVQLLDVQYAMQALISAVFSIVFQAIAQGFFPRFHVQHTSDHVRPFPVSCSVCCITTPGSSKMLCVVNMHAIIL